MTEASNQKGTEVTHDNSQPRWWSRSFQIGAIIAVVLLFLGPLGTKFGIWSFALGLPLMLGSAVLSAIGLIGGLWGYMIARGKGLAVDKPLCAMAAGISAVILAVLYIQASPAFSVPPIHNITTDINDPPAFRAVKALRGEDTNPLDYDSALIGPAQKEAYPDLQTLTTSLDAAAALSRSVEVLGEMGLEIVAKDPTANLVEATFTSFWFGFKDDVVVRVRPAAGGSQIDVRSVSRVGQSDLGANAKRIAEFLGRFES